MRITYIAMSPMAGSVKSVRSCDEAARDHGVGKKQRIPVDGDIVNPEDGRALKAKDNAGRSGSRVAPFWFPTGDRPDETLARRADEKRTSKGGQFAEARHQVEIFFRRFLGEAEAGIENDPVVLNAGVAGDLQRAPEKEKLV